VIARRFGRAIAATLCSLTLLYLSVVAWLVWAEPPFDLSGIDGHVTLDRQRSGFVMWPILLSVLTILAIAMASVAWGRARHLPRPPSQRE